MLGRVRLNLHEFDNDSSTILSAFRQAAEEQGWSEDDIDSVVDELKEDADFYRMINILSNYTEPDYLFSDDLEKEYDDDEDEYDDWGDTYEDELNLDDIPDGYLIEED